MQLELRKEQFYPILLDITDLFDEIEPQLRLTGFEVDNVIEEHTGTLSAHKDAVWRTILGMSYSFQMLVQHENDGTTVRIATQELPKRLLAFLGGMILRGGIGAIPSVAGAIFQQNLLLEVWKIVDKCYAAQQRGSADRTSPLPASNIEMRACLDPNCGTLLPVDAAYCTSCGMVLQCERCHTLRLSATDRFCHKCRNEYKISD